MKFSGRKRVFGLECSGAVVSGGAQSHESFSESIFGSNPVALFCPCSDSDARGWQPQALADSPPMDCGDFWPASGGTPDVATGGAFACREYDPLDPTLLVGPGTNFRIFYTSEWDRFPRPDSVAFLEA